MVTEKVCKAITVYVPGNACNLRCGYCYVTECLKKNREGVKAEFVYSIEHMIKAFQPDRIGGIAYFTVIGAGETLIPEEVIPFVHGLLDYGHVVEVVTNNTLNKKIEQLLDTSEENRKRLIVKCSLHWNELKRLNLLEDYFCNMRKVLERGASAYPFLVLSEEYIKALDEICDACMREIGALPQCTPCVIAEEREDFLRGGEATTNPPCTPEFVKKIENKLQSKVFKESVRFLDVDVKNVFCYAGQYAFIVEMGTGALRKCHNTEIIMNFFEDIEKKYVSEPLGCECGVATCSLQYPLFGMGMVPEIVDVPTYAKMVCDREGLFTEKVREMMDVKIPEKNGMFTKDDESHYLMKLICEKNDIICKNQILIGQQRQLLEVLKCRTQSEQELVQDILQKVDTNKLTYQELTEIRYEHIVAVYKVCTTMPNGMETCCHVLEQIYRGLLESHNYQSVAVVYEKGVISNLDGMQKLPVTILISESKNQGRLENYIKDLDSKRVAEYMLEQIGYMVGEC